MKRREFIGGLAGTATWPLAALAQQGLPLIGFLGSGSRIDSAERVQEFFEGLKEVGYVNGRNVALDFRWGEDEYHQLPAFAADLVRRQVAVLVAAGGPSASAAKAASDTIPIVFFVGLDPIELGLTAGLSRPSGNLTGVSVLNVELGPKRLEVLHELAPTRRVVALIVNPTNPNAETLSRDLHAAARVIGLELHVFHASSEADFPNIFSSIIRIRAGALVIGPDPFLIGRSEVLAALTLRHAIPAIFQFRRFAAAGGLVSYGPSVTEGYRQVGLYTGRILKGEKPADLPVIQATKVETIINLRTAKILGLSVPDQLLRRADEVIE